MSQERSNNNRDESELDNSDGLNAIEAAMEGEDGNNSVNGVGAGADGTTGDGVTGDEATGHLDGGGVGEEEAVETEYCFEDILEGLTLLETAEILVGAVVGIGQTAVSGQNTQKAIDRLVYLFYHDHSEFISYITEITENSVAVWQSADEKLKAQGSTIKPETVETLRANSRKLISIMGRHIDRIKNILHAVKQKEKDDTDENCDNDEYDE